jgi:hypothetical protein
MTFTLGKDTWHIAQVKNVCFIDVKKEVASHGYIYAAYCSCETGLWIAQSITALCTMINRECQCHVYFSSFYRYLRGLQKRPCNKKWIVKRVSSASELNKIAESFTDFFVCSKDLFLWEVEVKDHICTEAPAPLMSNTQS